MWLWLLWWSSLLSCHEDERSALLQFKRSFVVDKSTCRYEGDYPKTSYWDSKEGSSNCCSWDGVECDLEIGHVIGLDLSGGCIYGSIHSSSTLFHLIHLRKLNLAFNHFNRSSIPTSIGQLSEMVYLNLSSSFFFGQVPSEIFRLSKLSSLDLSLNYDNFTRERFLKLKSPNLRGLVRNFSCLEILRISYVDVPSEMPDLLANFSSLTDLRLGYTGLYGSIPSSLSKLSQLTRLDLYYNHLSGHIPSSLQNLTQLIGLRIYGNQISGPIPSWCGNLTKLNVLAFADNIFYGPISQSLFKLNNLEKLYLNRNHLDGTVEFNMFLNMTRLAQLSLSFNKLSIFFGARNMNTTTLPKFKILGLSSCNIWKLPRSLATCMMLEFIDFSNNKLADVFPTWLGTLPGLKVLFLQKNGFHGSIRRTKNTLEFPYLHIIDISYNSFTGALPSEYLFIWNGVKASEMSNSTYMHAREPFTGSHHDVFLYHYNYTANLIIKSVRTYYEKIRDELAVIDLSCNRFSGMIPEFNGNLVALRSLNLSNNMLTGRIPLSVGNLSQLESLDLSQNMLSGEIPQQLRQLNFLQSFNVSHNNLTGPIPQGNQLHTFDPTSFEGNPGLCGDPLPKKCGDSESFLPPTSADEEDDDSGSLIKLDWKFVLAGAISGFVVGVALGDMVIYQRHV
ncbi:hypothetical protein TIFTF001_025511 [Ficus carica]|uniref:Leucine-rich repeat-containing N-terminal plant-type domain-containing protein n=1 Tax=Ficus carica TaxID=3494 RepID=A0AA88DH99_FICCA|nr:hypothetical protein TIFTF001_025511 [Ficus carica]